MSTTKDKYYWAQLRAALTAGQWSSTQPCTAPNGARLSWSELFRKFKKHCQGYGDVCTVAEQTYSLALLLEAGDDGEEAGGHMLECGDECVLREEMRGEAEAGYAELKKMADGRKNFDTLNFALAYYAYALGDAEECLVHLGRVPDVVHVQNHIPLPDTLRASSITLAAPLAASAISATSAAPSAFSIADSALSIPDIRDGRAWALTETFRSLCLQGLAQERLAPNDLRRAAKSYAAAIPLLVIVENEFTTATTTHTTPTGRLDFSQFTRCREMWRWVERLIWRAILLAARTGNALDGESVLWAWLGHYSACSAFWPSNFRTGHRSAISVLYLRALIIRHGPTSAARKLPTAVSKPPLWLAVARGVIQEYRAILSVSTHFPKAGERNTKVEEFADLCVGIWEASGAIGEYAGWVLDVLWWATRMTFNSYKIIRYMTRLLHVSGDTNLAKRTLRLYIQVVGKAHKVNADADTDQHWVETLVFGMRMLCRNASLSHGLDNIEDVKEAETLVEQAYLRLDKENKKLTGSLELAEGICQSILALKQQDSHTRAARLARAHELFERSCSTHPAPAAYYHLALSFSNQRDVQNALENAGRAVEGDPEDPRYWHLLGLLSAAREEWQAATMAIDTGLSLWESDSADSNGLPPSDDADGARLEIPPQGHKHIDGLPVRHEATTSSDEPSLVFLLSKEDSTIPPAENLLRPAEEQMLPSQSQRFDDALQLRMTQVALAEVVEGSEGAAERLVDIFTWIAERKGGGETRTARSSLDGGRPPTMDLKSPSELVLPPPSIPEVPEEVEEKKPSHADSSDLLPVPPIPITISPATPDEQSQPNLTIHINRDSKEKERDSKDRERDHDSSAKKVQQKLLSQVHKSSARISTISKKIGNGVVRNGSLKRSTSTPDFHAVFRNTNYQASSIHSRRRLGSSLIKPADSIRGESPPPPPSAMLPPQTRLNQRNTMGSKLLSDVWLMSAATFRRLGKIEQAKGAIQEAEVRDEGNPGVWVQLGLYHVALGHHREALDAFQKALFIDPDNVAAVVHLCRLYLEPEVATPLDSVDLAAGMLGHLTGGVGWDVPEAWYYLAKAYGLQGRHVQERECLSLALSLSESRGVREIGAALGWCL